LALYVITINLYSKIDLRAEIWSAAWHPEDPTKFATCSED